MSPPSKRWRFIGMIGRDRTRVFAVGSNLLRLPARSPTDWTISRITRPERGPEGGKSRRGRLWHNFQDCCFEFGRPSPLDQFLHAASFFHEFSPQTKSYGLAQTPPTVFFDRGGLQFYFEIRTGPCPFLGAGVFQALCRPHVRISTPRNGVGTSLFC